MNLKTVSKPTCRRPYNDSLPLTGLQNDQVMSAEWEKTSVQELDVTATDLSTDCLVDLLTRIPSLRWLSAGQLDGFTDAVRGESAQRLVQALPSPIGSFVLTCRIILFFRVLF